LRERGGIALGIALELEAWLKGTGRSAFLPAPVVLIRGGIGRACRKVNSWWPSLSHLAQLVLMRDARCSLDVIGPTDERSSHVSSSSMACGPHNVRGYDVCFILRRQAYSPALTIGEGGPFLIAF